MIGQGMDEIACIVEDQPPGKKEPTGERIEREGIMNPNGEDKSHQVTAYKREEFLVQQLSILQPLTHAFLGVYRNYY